MSDINVAQMAESAASTYVNTEQQSNAANANAYLAPANMIPESIIDGDSLLIEPSENGIPEAPTGGAAPKTKIPGSLKMEGAGSASGTRPEGTSRASSGTSFRTGGHQENRIDSDKTNRNIGHSEHSTHQEEILKNESMKSLKQSHLESLNNQAA